VQRDSPSNWESWHYKDCLLNALRKLDNVKVQASALDEVASFVYDELKVSFEIKEMKAQEIADAADISQRSQDFNKDEKSKQEHWAEIESLADQLPGMDIDAGIAMFCKVGDGGRWFRGVKMM